MRSTEEFTGTLSSGPGEIMCALPGELFSVVSFNTLPPVSSSFLPVFLLDSFSVFRLT